MKMRTGLLFVLLLAGRPLRASGIESATVDGEAGSQKAKRTVRHQYGDPRFLDIVLRCNEARRKLLGIDAPTKIAPTLPDGQPLTLEERRIVAGRLHDLSRARAVEMAQVRLDLRIDLDRKRRRVLQACRILP